jgi:GTP pyrophosphokinase
MSSHGDKIISANWESKKILSYLASISITGIDQLGIVNKITKVISDEKEVNMKSINFESHEGIFNGSIYLYIHNKDALNNIIENITMINGVYNVSRQERINEK